MAWREIRRVTDPMRNINYSDISDYFNVMDMRLSPHYVRLLLEFDYKFRVHYIDIQEDLMNRQNTTTPKPKSEVEE